MQQVMRPVWLARNGNIICHIKIKEFFATHHFPSLILSLRLCSLIVFTFEMWKSCVWMDWKDTEWILSHKCNSYFNTIENAILLFTMMAQIRHCFCKCSHFSLIILIMQCETRFLLFFPFLSLSPTLAHWKALMRYSFLFQTDCCTCIRRRLGINIYKLINVNMCSVLVVFVSKQMKNGLDCDLNNLNIARRICGYGSWLNSVYAHKL